VYDLARPFGQFGWDFGTEQFRVLPFFSTVTTTFEEL
jgi:hypothetical protein